MAKRGKLLFAACGHIGLGADCRRCLTVQVLERKAKKLELKLEAEKRPAKLSELSEQIAWIAAEVLRLKKPSLGKTAARKAKRALPSEAAFEKTTNDDDFLPEEGVVG